jgi:hypothetical protein
MYSFQLHSKGDVPEEKDGIAVGSSHFRIADAADDAVAFCYQRANAELVTNALNGFKARDDAGKLPTFPSLDEEVQDILGRPNFACRELAVMLRNKGWEIPTKAECEQAAVLYFCLRMYAMHGEGWRKKAQDLLSTEGTLDVPNWLNN